MCRGKAGCNSRVAEGQCGKAGQDAEMPENREVVEKYYLLFLGKVLKPGESLYYYVGIPVYASIIHLNYPYVSLV